ncbi:hypothetical protein TWF694_000227 [Orbilia ellipsospora]|uniref:Uncharacterized protein n=1 Tax=Orbilia ellipsospora TaxID=2528407 RepID=A0AAV9XNF4_9PEZI
MSYTMDYRYVHGPVIQWDNREPMPPAHLRAGLSFKAAKIEQQKYVRYPHVNPVADSPRPVVRPNKESLPPLHASVKVQIIQDTAKVSVTHLFFNDSAKDVPEASYTFPLFQGCTVTDFVCRVGNDRVLKSMVKPKEEARAAFRDAVDRNESAALLEQNSPEIFTTTLGAIPANCRLKVDISFIILLGYRFQDGYGLTTFTLPIHIAPRFGAPPPGLQKAMQVSVGLKSLTMEIDVLAPEKIVAVNCETHATTVEIGVSGRNCQSWQEFVMLGERENPKSALVQLKESVTHLDRDFVLEIKTLPEASLEVPKACIETHTELENHRAVMLTIPPAYMLKSNGATSNTAGGEIVFVADRSGSMQDKMIALKSAMQFFLKGIPTDRKFNVWSFGSRHEYLWQESRSYSEANLQEALKYVSVCFRSNMGGTQLLPALKSVVTAKGQFNTLDIVTLTDGEVWDLDQTLGFVDDTRKKSEGRVRFFCLGIGAAVSHALVEGVAKLGGGYAEVIPLASQGGWESRVVAVLKAALEDHISFIDIEMEIESGQPIPSNEPPEKQKSGINYVASSQKMIQSPAKVYNLSPFLRNRVFMLFESLKPGSIGTRIKLKMNKPGEEPVTMLVPLESLKNQDTMLHKFAARAILGDLERGEIHDKLKPEGSVIDPWEEKNLITREGERLGCKWSLVSKWTSFFAEENLFQVTDDNRDNFMDAEGELVTIASEDDFDLLQPRGAQATGAVRLEELPGEPKSDSDEDINLGIETVMTSEARGDDSDDGSESNNTPVGGGSDESQRNSQSQANSSGDYHLGRW